jgi:hypothetical protein
LKRTPEELLEELLAAADEARATQHHKSAAYGALASFLDQGSSAKDGIRDICINSAVFQRVLHIYLQRSEGHAAKPMRQLLKTLAKILKLQDAQPSRTNVTSAVQSCLSYVLNHDDPTGVKAAMLTLECLLKPEFLSPKDLLELVGKYPVSSASFAAPQDSRFSDTLTVHAYCLFRHILQWATLVHIARAAGSLILNFCKASQSCPDLQDPFFKSADLWMLPVRDMLREDESTLEVLERDVLPNLYQLDIAQTINSLRPDLQKLQGLLVADMLESDIRFCLLSFKFLSPPTTYDHSGNSFSFYTSQILTFIAHLLVSRHEIVTDYLCQLLSHRSSKIRASALDFIASAYTLPDHIDWRILEHVVQVLPSFLAEPNPQARNDILSTMKRVLLRIEISISRLDKDITSKEISTSNGQEDPGLKGVIYILNCHEMFVRDFCSQLRAGLRVSAPYQQHISSLRIMESLLPIRGSIKWVRSESSC